MPAKKQKNATQQSLPYRTGEGSYNRQSGERTLAFVAVLLFFIVAFTILSLILLNHR